MAAFSQFFGERRRSNLPAEYRISIQYPGSDTLWHEPVAVLLPVAVSNAFDVMHRPYAEHRSISVRMIPVSNKIKKQLLLFT